MLTSLACCSNWAWRQCRARKCISMEFEEMHLDSQVHLLIQN